MSDLQEQAKPRLTSLIKGVWDEFDTQTAAIVSTWMTMTTMVIDASYPDSSGVSIEERKHLMNTKTPPEHWQFWAGRRSGGEDLGYYHRGFAIVSRDEVKRDFRNSQITTLDLGQLVLHCVSIPSRYYVIPHMEYGRALGIIPIVPWGGDVLNWRTAPILNNNEVARVANLLTHQLVGSSAFRIPSDDRPATDGTS